MSYTIYRLLEVIQRLFRQTQ